ncbi:MAG TPA: hypothetical protein VGJ81_15880 [Thermoanaerobaculia bacterium]|jgi:hypothetical protein
MIGDPLLVASRRSVRAPAEVSKSSLSYPNETEFAPLMLSETVRKLLS